MRQHSDEKPLYCCEYCGKTFLTSRQCNRHVNDNHKPRTQLEKVCEVCGKICQNGKSLHQHISSEHNVPVDKKECIDCKMVFPSKKGYLNHYVTTHLKYEDIDKFPVKVHACPTCHKLFMSQYRLDLHIRTHNDDKREVCNICGKRFFYKIHLAVHKKIHYDRKREVCNICGKKFFKKGHLDNHMRIHTNDKLFVCEICDKRFIHAQGLKIHLKSHNAGNKLDKKATADEPGRDEEMDISDLEETETAVLDVLSSNANENVVYEGEYQDTEAAILEDDSGCNSPRTDVDEGGDAEEFSNETVTCEDKNKDVEGNMPIELEENNSALQLLLWDNLVVGDGDVNLPSLEPS